MPQFKLSVQCSYSVLKLLFFTLSYILSLLGAISINK